MVDPFYIKLILAFILGAIWITGATILAEKFGTKIGGAISGIPSTAVLALFFIGWTQSPQIAANATGIVPAIIGLDALFIAIYILYSQHKLHISLGVSLGFWLVLTILFISVKLTNFYVSLLIFFVFYVASYVIGEKIVQVKSEGKRAIVYTKRQLTIRALSSGAIVCFAVIMARVGGPILGGVFSAFPAIMLGTLIITYLTHGRNFSVAIMKVMMVSGSLNVTIYAASVRIFYPILGLISGTVLSFSISLISSYLTYQLISKKMR